MKLNEMLEMNSANVIPDVSTMDGVKEISIISMSVVCEFMMNTDQRPS
jgi:hypothetical protein